MDDALRRFSWPNAERALAVCPHVDDELGCAGLIIRLLEQGADVTYFALSRCERSVPPPLPEDALERECRKATAALGLLEDHVSVLRYPVRDFPQHRQDILEFLVEANRKYAPNLVMVPSSFDNHQDHATVRQESFRAFKHSTILGYELPQNLISFSNTAFVALTEQHINRKIQALGEYASQGFRRYTSPDFIRSLATVRGIQCNSPYAEAYEVVRLIL